MTAATTIGITRSARRSGFAADAPALAGRFGMPPRIWMAVAALAIAAATADVASALPIDGGREVGPPDVFYNYYVPPVPAGSYPGLGAQLYVSPRPVPPRVGHTWYTYPPFLPHEFLYKHHRRTIRPAGAKGMRTVAHSYYW